MRNSDIRRAIASAVVVVCLCVSQASAAGFVIEDRAFFASISHLLIDFESEADGTAIDLDFDEFVLLDGDEYFSLGVSFRFGGFMGVFKSGSPSTRDALRIGGSLDNILSFGTIDPTSPFEILFDTPVRAAGFFALTSDDLPGPEFEAFNASGGSLGHFALDGALQDGIIDGVAFGYIGIATEEPIARIALANGAIGWGIDDLRFSEVPAPGGVALLALGSLALGRRRR